MRIGGNCTELSETELQADFAMGVALTVVIPKVICVLQAEAACIGPCEGTVHVRGTLAPLDAIGSY